MSLLLDTHLLLWVAQDIDRVPKAARDQIEIQFGEIYFSVVSLWEVAIKFSLKREDFKTHPQLLRRGLLDHGYIELEMTAEHAIGVANLPFLHKDPFDRLLVAQAISEEMFLLTTDAKIADYPGPIRLV